MNKICKEFINSSRKSIFPLIRSSLILQNYKIIYTCPKHFSKKTSSRKKEDFDMFYGNLKIKEGIPLSKSKPKNEEELINLFNHVRNTEDILDLYEKNKELFTDRLIPYYIEFLHKALTKQYSKILQGKTENIPLNELEDLQKEHVHSENRIITMFNELENEIFTKEFSFRCQIHFYFYSFFEFKFTFNKENNYIYNIFTVTYILLKRLQKDPFVLATIEHNDVIKLTKILCNYEKFDVPFDEARKNFKILSKEIETMEYSKLTHDEIIQFISSLTHKNLCDNIEIYTRFEPHILKFLDKYSLSDQIRLFCYYIEISAGTDFFLDTLSFSIKKLLNNATLKDILCLLNVSKRSVWEKRYYSNTHFNNVFENVHLLVMNKLNNVNKKDLIRLNMRLIELGYNEKTIIQLLSTKLLAQAEYMNFEDFIKVIFYNFTVVDFNSEVFLRKCVDIVRMNLLCLKNRKVLINTGLKGFNEIENLQGFMEKDLIFTLKNKFEPNNEKLIEMIKSSNNFKTFKETFNILTSLLWSMTYYSMHVDLKSINYTEIMNDTIEVFNKLLEKMKNFDKIQLEIINLHKIIQFNLYLQLNSKKYNISNKLNMDFLKKITFYYPPSEEAQSETYIYFVNKIRKNINQLKTFTPYKLKNQTISNENLKFTLIPSFFLETKQKNGELKYTFVFINDISFYLHHSKIYNALIKLRKQFCKEMNIEYIDLDYYEWKEINEIKEINLEKADQQIEEYLKMKFIKLNV